MSLRRRDNARAAKRCGGPCGRVLPLTAEFFHVDEQSSDGRQSYCKSCKASATQEARWLREYGFTAATAERCLTAQGHRCPICGGSLDFSMRIHVDHDHDTEEVRGLLHARCNTSPPKNGEGAKRWAAYCLDPPMRKVNFGYPLLRAASGLGVAQLELL